MMTNVSATTKLKRTFLQFNAQCYVDNRVDDFCVRKNVPGIHLGFVVSINKYFKYRAITLPVRTVHSQMNVFAMRQRSSAHFVLLPV